MQQISQSENFDTIVQQYGPMVYGTCIRILNDPGKAEDATQETFVKFLESSSQIRKNVGGWLHRVAISQALTHIRAEKRREQRQKAWANTKDTTPGPEWTEIRCLIDEAIDELPDELREPLSLYFFERKTHREIARATGIARRTVGYRIQKGVEVIQSRIKSKGIDIAVAPLGALLANNLTREVPQTLASELAKMSIVGNATPAATATGVASVLSSIATLRAILAIFVVTAVGVTTLALMNRNESDDSSAATAPSVPISTATTASVIPAEAPALEAAATTEPAPEGPPTLQLAASTESEDAGVEDTPDTVLLHGRVFDRETDKNIPDVRIYTGRPTTTDQFVTVEGTEINTSAYVATDSYGYFHLNVLPDTSIILCMGAVDGYVPTGPWSPSENDIWINLSKVYIDSDTDSEHYREIHMQQANGMLQGRVFLGNSPASRVEFSINGIGPLQSKTYTTDADGNYTIQGIPTVTADIGARIKTEDGVRRDSPLVLTSLKTGETIDADFYFAWGAIELSGRVTSEVASGFEPVKDKNVTLIYQYWDEDQQKPNRDYLHTSTDEDGNYTISNLSVGRVIVEVSSPAGVAQRTWVNLPTTDETAGDIILNSSSIIGKVTNAPEGRSVFISVYPGIQNPIEEARRTGFETTFLRFEEMQLGWTGAGGTLDGLPPGTYTVLAAAWPVTGLRGVREMGIEKFKENFRVAFKTVYIQEYGQKVTVTLSDFQKVE